MVTADTRAAAAGEPRAALIEAGAPLDDAGTLANASGMVQEYLPIEDGSGEVLAIVAMWRDAADLMARLDATRRDIMLVTLAAAVLLAGVLFLVFRAAQARLSRQHRQLIESTPRRVDRDANHGRSSRCSPTRSRRPVGRRTHRRALLDVDNFRLFNAHTATRPPTRSC